MLTPDSSFAQIEASSREGAVLPIGAFEQHGRHMSLNTDTVVAAALAEKVAEAFGWFLLPALPYGNSLEHIDFPGTITLTPNTLATVVKDIAASIRHHNFKTLTIISGHGGNWILKPTVRELNLNPPPGPNKLKVLLIDPETYYYPIVDRPGLHHAGEYETSLMLHVRPQGVQMHLAPGTGAEPAMPRALLDCVPLRKILPNGVWGIPEKATADLGKKSMNIAIKNCIDHIRQMLRAIE